MAGFRQKRILAHCPAEGFIGRSTELEHLLNHAVSERESPGLLLLSLPGIGSSELLRQTYDQLFTGQAEIIPFYFALSKYDKTVRQTASRFMQQFVMQAVAFRRFDPKILGISPDLDELAQLAPPDDANWIDRLIEAASRDLRFSDDQTFIRNCLRAPLRAAAGGAKVFIMLDDLYETHGLDNGVELVDEVQNIFVRPDVSFVFSARRKSNFGEMNCERLSLEPLSFHDTAALIEYLAQRRHVEINDQTRDLIATQFRGNLTHIDYIFQTANEKREDLNSFQKVEQVYVDALLRGRIGKFYEVLFRSIMPNPETRKNILSLLNEMVGAGNEHPALETWQKRLNFGDEEFSRFMNLLTVQEIIQISSNRIDAMAENEVLNDYITASFRLESAGENCELVFGETLSASIKRAPVIMAHFYRQNSAIGLREMMAAFNSQEIPLALIDYGLFENEYKGNSEEELLSSLNSSGTRKIRLPQIVHTTHIAAIYKPVKLVSEKERSAVAFGFQEGNFTDADEIVWIAAEIDSKLEATKELTEFWCDRLELVAAVCSFINYKLWLIAPEGFSPEASEVLQNRNYFGSSRKQVGLLAQFLKTGQSKDKKQNTDEYEITVPMGDDSELIAALALEEIARRRHYDSKAINQIKTAMIEACINASEHSLSPDRKIYQKFTFEDDRIVITVSNRGLRLADRSFDETEQDNGRRGWGLKLMKHLMDEVKFEQTDDGTRISMTKYLTAERRA